MGEDGERKEKEHSFASQILICKSNTGAIFLRLGLLACLMVKEKSGYLTKVAGGKLKVLT